MGRFPTEFVVAFVGRLVEVPAPAGMERLGPCQLWQGALGKDGYGNCSYQGETLRCHHVGFELWTGRPPGGEVLRHRCNRRLCCAGLHLVEGTTLQNWQDSVRAGTHQDPPHPCGSSHPSSKLDAADVADIKRRLARGDTQTEIARDKGVSQPLVSAIKNGKARTCR